MRNSSSSSSSCCCRALAVRLDQLQHRHDVVFDAEAAEDRGLLRQIADAEAGAPVHRQPGDVAAVDQDAAAVDRNETGDHVEHGGLAGTVRSQQPDRLAAADGETDPAHHLALAETLLDVARLQPAVGRVLLQRRPAGNRSRLPGATAAGGAARPRPRWRLIGIGHDLGSRQRCSRMPSASSLIEWLCGLQWAELSILRRHGCVGAADFCFFMRSWKSRGMARRQTRPGGSHRRRRGRCRPWRRRSRASSGRS